MRLQLFLLISFCLLMGAFCDDDVRKLKVTINPNCTDSDCTTNIQVLHIEADSDTDRLHYIYDFTGKPAVLIAKGDKNSLLEIDWNEFKNNSENSIKITPQPSYTFSTFINFFVIFNDTKDTSNFSDPSVVEFYEIDPLNVSWTKVSLDASEQNVTLVMKGQNRLGGSFTIKYTAHGSSGHGADLPHLFHTSHSMQIDLVATNISSPYQNPRIAFQLVMIPDEAKSEGDFSLNRIRNLDDEFTPGIFDVYNFVSPRSNNDARGSFIQYRPVCYNSEIRSVSSSTESRHGPPTDANDIRYEFTLPYAFYGKVEFEKKIHQAVNITLGMPDSDFYSKTNYISFSYLMGIGNPPLEGLSPFVITFAVIGLGVPLLVLIVGGTYVAVKRYSS